MKVRITYKCGKVEEQVWPFIDTTITYSHHSFPKNVEKIDVISLA